MPDLTARVCNDSDSYSSNPDDDSVEWVDAPDDADDELSKDSSNLQWCTSDKNSQVSCSQNSDDLCDLLDSNDPVYYLDDLHAKEIPMSTFDNFEDIPISKFDVTNQESDEDSHGSCSEDSNDFYIVEDDPETSD